MKKITVRDQTYFYLKGMQDFEDRHYKLLNAFRALYLMFNDPTIDQHVDVYKRLGMEPIPPKSKIGKYVMTDKGMMYYAYRKYFTLGKNYKVLFDVPYSLPVTKIRDVTGFDF